MATTDYADTTLGDAAADSRGYRPVHAGKPAWVALRAWVGEDHLTRNSLCLMLNAGIQGGLGFAFWLITARLFSAEDIGRASSLVSANTVIAYLALLGLNSGFGRCLPTAVNRQEIISSGIAVVAACGAVMALGYVVVAPLMVPGLAFVTHAPWLAAGFVLVTAAAAVNLLTDSVFVAARKGVYIPVVDGAIGGVGKVLSAVLLTGAGASGLFFAAAVGAALPALVSLVLIFTVMRYRVSVKRPLRTLRPMLRFSGANYLGNVLLMLPALIVPLLVIARLGPAPAGYYFVDFQVASILYAAALSVEQSFLSEGSRAGINMRRLKRRSRRVLIALLFPPSLVLAVLGNRILLAFGPHFSRFGTPSLVILAIGAIPVAVNYWIMTVLRLAGRLRALISVAGIYAGSICGLAWLGSSHGLAWVAAAWPAGALLASASGGLALLVGNREQRRLPRHRHARPQVIDWGRRRRWLAGGMLATAAIVASVVTPSLRHQWALSLTRQPTRYTALAFSNASTLPVAAISGQGIYVSFTISNKEGHAMSYRYLVSSGSGAQLWPQFSVSQTVPDGATWTVSRWMLPDCTGANCRIEVSLPGQGEAIDFAFLLSPKPKKR